jgi:PadR family transcriptional regulator, regulatory protein PadR
MNLDNTKSQMRKGILEFCILACLTRGEAYPGDIIEEVRAAGLDLLEGTLYPLLTRLKNAGMLSYRWEESTSGPPRKYYALSPAGETFYEELNQNWNNMAKAVNTINKKK